MSIDAGDVVCYYEARPKARAHETILGSIGIQSPLPFIPKRPERKFRLLHSAYAP